MRAFAIRFGRNLLVLFAISGVLAFANGAIRSYVKPINQQVPYTSCHRIYASAKWQLACH